MPMQDPGRRVFLRQLGGGAAAVAALPVLAGEPAAPEPSWRNWSGHLTSQAPVAYPTTEAELQALLRVSTGSVRVVGGSHSFYPLVPGADQLISLEALGGLRSHDVAALRATYGGGTRLATASAAAWDVGMSFVNQPDIDMQSLGGAISTSTHGTGLSLPSLSGQVTGARLVLADGSVLNVSADENAALLPAVKVGVGSLGVLSEITFQHTAAYKLREDTLVMSIDEALKFIETKRHTDRQIEFWAFPYGNKAIVKRTHITTEADTSVEEEFLDQNKALEWAADLSMHAPWLTGLLQRLVGTFISEDSRIAPSNQIFANVRAVAFNEMEYTVPAEKGIECLAEALETMRKSDINVFFPLEFRYTAADDAWLSQFSGRAGASISVHQYHRLDYKPLFDSVEPVFWKYQGRPHWGKLHTLTAKELRPLYPEWDRFQKVRAELDPKGRFLTPKMKTLLGVA